MNLHNDFIERHIEPSKNDTTNMIQELNMNSLDELIDKTIPKNIKLNHDLNLPQSMSEPRYLEVQQENLDFPLDGQIHLVENFFAGNGYIVCSWPFYFEGENNSQIHENRIDNHIVKTIDFLGRETNQNGLHINLYNDGSVKKTLK